jgi:hypothetical protein
MPLFISGIAYIPFGVTATNSLGDIGMSFHSTNLQGGQFGANQAPVDTAEASARALGPGALYINTGSGIVNMLTGSGIAMIGMKADNNIPYLLDNWGRIGMSGILMYDSMIVPNIVGSGVTFMMDGMYLVDYNITFIKLLGATARTIAVRAILKDKGSEGELAGTPLLGGSAIQGSLSYTQVTNVTTLPFSTANAAFFVNVKAGQFLGFEAAAAGTGTVAGQTVQAIASGTTATIQYIGPRRTFPVLA